MTLNHEIQDRISSLRKFYVQLAAPAAALFVLIYVLRRFGLGPLENETLQLVGGPAVFISAALLSLAAPILHRGIFAHRIRNERSVVTERYTVYQKTQMALALSTPYVALAGFVMDVSRFHFLGAVLFALYGLYYYYPSENRIRREMRMFRVTDESSEQ
jgi:hypothetical protein